MDRLRDLIEKALPANQPFTFDRFRIWIRDTLTCIVGGVDSGGIPRTRIKSRRGVQEFLDTFVPELKRTYAEHPELIPQIRQYIEQLTPRRGLWRERMLADVLKENLPET